MAANLVTAWVHPAGVFGRLGISEIAADLVRCAGAGDLAVVASVAPDLAPGDRRGAAASLARRHALPRVNGADVIDRRAATGHFVDHAVAEVSLPTAHGHFMVDGYRAVDSGREHILLWRGRRPLSPGCPVHLFSAADRWSIFELIADRENNQIARALSEIDRAGSGALVYLGASDPGSVLADLTDSPMAQCAQMLMDVGLGVRSWRRAAAGAGIAPVLS
ncbi:MAG: hypothetical protein JST08_06940 [Actinobacteria bacterium]|nr:hypothetical protein [Actinomycetota bacterium]